MKTTEAQRKALSVLDLDGEAYVSNVTDVANRTIYWQTARWLVNHGYARRLGEDVAGRETLGITAKGRQAA